MKKALGRGLSALIPDTYIKAAAAQGTGAGDVKVEGLELIPIGQIAPNPEQPRETFRLEGIEELAQSIKEKGVLQPVVVRRRQGALGAGEGEIPYELICGERRLKAASLSGLEKIPAIVKEAAAEDLLEWALVENIQREDLNPLEEARAFERLVMERALSQEEVAKRVGKNRTTVTNAIRLLRLPDEVLKLVRDGSLSAGHARALLGLFTDEQKVQLAKRILKENLSVRQAEEIVARSARKRHARQARRLTPEVADLEMRLCRLLGSQVRILQLKNGREGRIVIQYFSLDELDRILKQMGLPQAV